MTVSAGFERAALDAATRAQIDATLGAMADELSIEDGAVAEAMRYALGNGAKRLRPMLCLAAMEAAGSATAGAVRVRAACALELVHTYSLVHDDLPCMDDDDLRRGRPTTHRAYGTPAAMLAGIALIPFASRVLYDAAVEMGVGAERAADAVRELCVAAGAGGMVGGQVLDLEAEGAQLGDGDLRRIHALKTGALFRASLRIGAVLGNAPTDVVDALGRYGEHLGMAFQITDDVLDVTMDSGALGKTPGKDAAADKTTFASQRSLGEARAAADEEVNRALAELARARLISPALEQLARFAASRER